MRQHAKQTQLTGEDQNSLEHKLQGRTLQVYLYLLKKSQPVGIRELQRDLGLSSPSVAEYQIVKLVELGIAQKDVYGQTRLVKKVKVKALNQYMEIGPRIIPRVALYAFVFTAVACTYAIVSWNSINFLAFAVCISASAIFWFETFKSRSSPESRDRAESAISQSDLHRQFWHSLVPGIIALAAFAAVAAFLYYYEAPAQPPRILMPLPPAVANANDPTAEPSPLSYSSSPSVEYSAEMSARKVQVAGPSDRLISTPDPELYVVAALSAAMVLGFILFLLAKYRSYETKCRIPYVLAMKQVSILSFEDQDYHPR
jgi:hypothetical protein